jgi:DNA (cytosine-5)-methyltransferase 1
MPVLSPYITGLRPWAVYNEFNPEAAEWIRWLMKYDAIAPGEVDERSITEVSADDYRSFTQQHFFAGIGTWSYCLRAGGVGDDFPVLTGSPPCQPFSVAGQSKGEDDERHLAPKFAELVAELGVGIIFGEQVSSALAVGKARTKRAPVVFDGEGNEIPPEWAWIDALHDQLEASFYTVGAQDIPAAGFGAPHIRQRLVLFAYHDRIAEGMGNSDSARATPWVSKQAQRQEGVAEVDDHGGCGLLRPESRRPITRILADDPQRGCGEERPDSGWITPGGDAQGIPAGSVDGCADDRLVDPNGGEQREAGSVQPGWEHGLQQEDGGGIRSGYRRTWHQQSCDMADAEREQWVGRRPGEAGLESGSVERAERLRDDDRVDDYNLAGLEGRESMPISRAGGEYARASADDRVGDASSQPSERHTGAVRAEEAERTRSRSADGGLDHGHPDAGETCILDAHPHRDLDSGDDLDRCFDDAIARLDAMRPSPTSGFWGDVDWLFCRDGKWRPTQPGILPLVDGSTGRLGSGSDPSIPVSEEYANATSEGRKMRLHGYGNGIVTDPTVEHIRNCVDILDREFPGWRWRAISLAESHAIMANQLRNGD